MTTVDPTQRLIAFSHELDWRDVPPETREILKLSLLDWLAVGRAGIGEPVSGIMRDTGLAEGGKPVASVFGLAEKLPTRMAALINGTTSHALDYDDTHFLHIGHPGVVIFSSVIAVAQQMNATGQQMLEAALIGFETSIRIGHWLGRAHYQAGFHMTATAGSFGAVLGVGRLLGLDNVQMQNALGLASTRASGLKAQFGTMGKPYNAGLAAANGVEAAMLAKAGMVSDASGLTRFSQTHCGENIDPETVLRGLGSRFVIDQISHKFHACCHGTHATLEALALIPVEASEVTQVNVTVHPRWLTVCNKPAPKTGLEAKFSYRLCVAMALAGVDTGALSSFSDANCADPTLIQLRDLVQVSGEDDLADTEARVEILCGADTGRTAHFDLAAPIEISARRDKVFAKARALLPNGAPDNQDEFPPPGGNFDLSDIEKWMQI